MNPGSSYWARSTREALEAQDEYDDLMVALAQKRAQAALDAKTAEVAALRAAGDSRLAEAHRQLLELIVRYD